MKNREQRFCDVARAARTARGLTQEQEAAELGVKQPAVSAWERGQAFPSAGPLVALARLLDLDVGHLLELIAAEQGGTSTELVTAR
jgi:transcriptional regulator with XRE-family HTH domain